MTKRVDSFSRIPPQAFTYQGGGGLAVKPNVPKITAYHFTPVVVDGELEPKRVQLQKAVDYYGAPELDPAVL